MTFNLGHLIQGKLNKQKLSWCPETRKYVIYNSDRTVKFRLN